MTNFRKRSEEPLPKSEPGFEDTLLIHYQDLASSPLTRLEVLTAIGQLLESPGEEHALGDLVNSPGAVQALRAWLIQEKPARFWNVEDNNIRLSNPCEKHILIGTRQLFQDLSMLEHVFSMPHLSDIDLLWQAAAKFVRSAHPPRVSSHEGRML